MTADVLRDLRENPDWFPLRGELTVGRWQISTWQEPVEPGRSAFDTVNVRVLGSSLRVFVIDPVHNVLVDDIDRKAWQLSGAIIAALHHYPDQDQALRAAAADAYRAQRPRQHRALAALAVVDIDLHSGQLRAQTVADGEVWIRNDDGWTQVCAEPILTTSGQQAYQVAQQAATWPEHFARKQELLDDPDMWHSPTLGFEDHPRPQQHSQPHVSELIVSTDGARLTADRCADLSAWLHNGLQSRECTDGTSPHGDLAVAHLRLRSDAAG